MPRKYSRRRRSRSSKRTTKKKSMRRPKSKKIRGGVTVRAQDLTRLPSDVLGEIREMHPLLTSKFNNITLRHAVKDYVSNSRAKMYLVRKHGGVLRRTYSVLTQIPSRLLLVDDTPACLKKVGKFIALVPTTWGSLAFRACKTRKTFPERLIPLR